MDVGVFFFKQKTAYEMRISDWSSDVCSSDLLAWWETGTHSMYTGQRARSDSAERLLFEDVKAVTTAFLVAYGFYDEEAFASVSGNLFQRVSRERVAMLDRKSTRLNSSH